jgi:small GTP-binding protein
MVEKEEPEFRILRKDPKYYDYTIKVILVGDSAVGKTCLVWRGVHGEFKERYDVTVGSEFSTYVCSVNGRVMKMQVWDTCGQEAQRSLARIFYKGSHCVVLVYSITRPETFANLESWIHDVKDVVKPDTLLFLVGNMLDEEDKRKVSRASVDALMAKEQIVAYLETSAKSGVGVNALFAQVAKSLYAQRHAPSPTSKTKAPTKGTGKGKGKDKDKDKDKSEKQAKGKAGAKDAAKAKAGRTKEEKDASNVHQLRRNPKRKKKSDECCP